MLTAGGVVLLYLSTYGAFGFYHLIGQRAAGLMLALIVAESGLLALRYEAPAIALMAVIGGLLTPLLMHADRDQYAALFSYLTVLDAGIVCLLLRRHWPAIGVVLYRMIEPSPDPGWGAYLALAGSILAWAGGLMSVRPKITGQCSPATRSSTSGTSPDTT